MEPGAKLQTNRKTRKNRGRMLELSRRVRNDFSVMSTALPIDKAAGENKQERTGNSKRIISSG